MDCGLDHVVPFQTRAFPNRSTATQKLADVQDTELSPPPLGSMDCGLDQLLPFHVSTLPFVSTATHTLIDVQDTELSAKPLLVVAESIPCKLDHTPPFQVKAFP